MWLWSIAFASPGAQCAVDGSLDPLGRASLVSVIEDRIRQPTATEARLDALIARYPRCGELYRLRAASRHGRGASAAARTDLERAIELGDEGAERALAIHAHHRGDGGELLQDAAEAGDDPWLWVLRSRELPPSQREGWLAQGMKRFPGDPDIVLERVEALATGGSPKRAVAVGRAFLETREHPILERRLAAIDDPFDGEEGPRARRASEVRMMEDGTEEVVVYSPERARLEVVRRLESLGWTDVKAIDGGYRYRTDDTVQPWIEIYDDGRVNVQKSGFVKVKSNSLATPIPIISARKLRGRRTELMEEVWLEVTTWRQALTRVRFRAQLDEVLPDQLTALWTRGTPFGSGPDLQTVGERRRALLDHWSSRACSPEGDAARLVVARFLLLEVAESQAGLPVEEVAAAEARCTCEGRRIVLP